MVIKHKHFGNNNSFKFSKAYNTIQAVKMTNHSMCSN